MKEYIIEISVSTTIGIEAESKDEAIKELLENSPDGKQMLIEALEEFGFEAKIKRTRRTLDVR